MSHSPENLPGLKPSKGTMRIAQVLSSGRGANSGLHLHPQGHRLISVWCGHDGTVDYWASDTARHLQSFALDVELADVGSQVDSAYMPPGTDAHAENWPVHQLPVVDSGMNALGGHLALAAGRGVRVFRTAVDESGLVASQNLRGHEQSVTRVALDASGERALSCDASGQVVVWDTVRGAPQHLLRISTAPRALGFIWNNMLAMAGDDTGRIICWELEHGRRHLQFQAHRGAVVRTAFNADSGVLLTTGTDNTARMWNLEEGRQIGQDMAHRSAICDVVFAYAGRFVVTCGADGHVAIWNSTDGDLLDWYFDSAPVYRLAFDRLNGTLVIAGARTIKVLSVDWQRLREVDADARSAILTGVNPADHAALFSAPPTDGIATSGPVAEAGPIGAIMNHQQTQEILLPENFGRIPRPGEAPAPDAPQSNPSEQFTSDPFASNLSDMLDSHANFLGAAAQENDVPPPSLADAMEQVRVRDEENGARTTSYGIGKQLHEHITDANAFFSGLGEDADDVRVSRMDSGLVSSTANVSAEKRLPAPRSGSGTAAVDAVVSNREERAKAETKRTWMMIGIVGLMVAIGLRVGTQVYFMKAVWPAGLGAEQAEIEATHRAEIMDIENAFAGVEADELANIARYRDSSSMSPDAVDRASERVHARIAEKAAERDAEIAVVERAQADAFQALTNRRRAAAGARANGVALLGGFLAALVAFVFTRKPKQTAVAATSTRRRLR